MRKMRKARVVGLSVVMVLLLPHGTADAPALTFIGCEQIFVSYPVPMETAESHLPPGFAAVKFTTDPSGNLGSISIYVDSCAHAGGVGDGGPFGEAWLLIRTVPPAPWIDPSATAHFFLVASSVDDPVIGATYAAWDLAAGASGGASLTTTSGLFSVYEVSARAWGPALGLAIEAVNAQDDLRWPEQHFRLFGRGPTGAIGAVHQQIHAGGFQSGIQVSGVTVSQGPAPTGSASGALGRDFRWAAGLDSWTLSPVPLPPLS